MNKRGFTLVEVIVVSVIVALLGTTAIMLYNGYIRDSAQTSLEGLAQTAASSARAFKMKTKTQPDEDDIKLQLIDPERYEWYVVENEDSLFFKDILHKCSVKVGFSIE